MTSDEAKTVLTTFNTKFEKMISFFQHKKFTLRRSFDNVAKVTTVELDIPSDEQIDAVLLHLRFFVVTNEATSYVKIPTAYQALTLPADVQKKFQDAYDRWTAWRAAPSRIGGHSNTEFFAHMIYGERVHRNKKDHCDVYDEWMRHTLIKDFATIGLCEAILSITRLVGGVYDVNREVLALP